MKKIKYLLMLVACCVLLAGCGANDNLKLQPTTMSISNFYHNAITESYTLYQEGIYNVGESLYDQYVNYVNLSNGFGLPSYALVSAMDLCSEIINQQSEESQKIYEYEVNNSVIVVVVSKINNSGKFLADLYFDEFQNESVDMSFTFTINKISDNTFTYNGSSDDLSFSGEFLFNKNLGKMKITIKDKAKDGYDFELRLYNYNGNIWGGRQYFKADSSSKKLVQEFLCKEFYKKGKIGYVKDESLYVNMENVKEDFIGVNNVGDDYGFMITYSHLTESKDTSVSSYGVVK